MVITIALFILAGLAEIGGGYLVWLWLRESKPFWYGIVGSIILVSYGIIPTLQNFPNHPTSTTGLDQRFVSLVYRLCYGLQEASFSV